jgi:hypothetical protein
MNIFKQISRSLAPPPTRAGIPQRAIIIIIALLGMNAARGQVVTGTQSIAFGQINRSATSSVPYSGATAARFTVTGHQARTVRITITTTSLSNAGNTLPITVNNGDCAYSIDNGITWHTFTSGTLFQDVVIPNGTGNGSDGSVLVRVGGTITAAQLQARGAYTGSVTANAAYR